VCYTDEIHTDEEECDVTGVAMIVRVHKFVDSKTHQLRRMSVHNRNPPRKENIPSPIASCSKLLFIVRDQHPGDDGTACAHIPLGGCLPVIIEVVAYQQ
jgi:hypothetical protein